MSESELNPREIKVLQSAADGLTCAATGKEVGIALGTVDNIRYSILSKLGADNIVQAVAMGLRRGIIQ